MSFSVNHGLSVLTFSGEAVNHKNEDVDVFVLLVVLLNVSFGLGVVQNKSEFCTSLFLAVDLSASEVDLDVVDFMKDLVVVEYILDVICVDFVLGA